jgi:hypothetical protein
MFLNGPVARIRSAAGAWAPQSSFPTPMTLPVVDDSRSIVVDIRAEFLNCASQFPQYQVHGSPRLVIFLNRAVHLKHQVLWFVY